MARYIDANKLQEDFKKIADEPDYMHEGETWQTGIYLAGTITDKQPTADVVEVKHGKWRSEMRERCDWKGKKQQYYQPNSCSVCHEAVVERTPYCPWCGAKMDGGKKDDL